MVAPDEGNGEFGVGEHDRGVGQVSGLSHRGEHGGCTGREVVDAEHGGEGLGVKCREGPSGAEGGERVECREREQDEQKEDRPSAEADTGGEGRGHGEASKGEGGMGDGGYGWHGPILRLVGRWRDKNHGKRCEWAGERCEAGDR